MSEGIIAVITIVVIFVYPNIFLLLLLFIVYKLSKRK